MKKRSKLRSLLRFLEIKVDTEFAEFVSNLWIQRTKSKLTKEEKQEYVRLSEEYRREACNYYSTFVVNNGNGYKTEDIVVINNDGNPDVSRYGL